MIFSVLMNFPVYSLEETPPQLEKARHVLNQLQEKHITSSYGERDIQENHYSVRCFEFVYHVLEESIPAPATSELLRLQQAVLEDLPLSHRSDMIIPYHYYLIASYLLKNTYVSEFWKAYEFSEAQKGDILIYIDPHYTPELKKGDLHQHPVTHVMFIDHIFKKEDVSLSMRVIDSSSRTKGRSYSPKEEASENNRIWKKAGIGYSSLEIYGHKTKNLGELLWTCQWTGQKKTMDKFFAILRLENLSK
jgi:hypothetical protein